MVCCDDPFFPLIQFEEYSRQFHLMADLCVGHHRQFILACPENTGHSIADLPNLFPPLFTRDRNPQLSPETEKLLQVRTAPEGTAPKELLMRQGQWLRIENSALVDSRFWSRFQGFSVRTSPLLSLKFQGVLVSAGKAAFDIMGDGFYEHV